MYYRNNGKGHGNYYSELRISGLRIKNFGLRAWGLRVRGSGLGFRAQSLGASSVLRLA